MKAQLLLILSCLIVLCFASSGDIQPEYNLCVDTCSSRPHLLPAYLRLFGWTVRDDCRYRCMQSITQEAIEQGARIHQYHGKWPFYRLYGIQEPASVLFSILNGLQHYKYFFRLKQQLSNTYYLKPIYMGISICGMNAWIWSTVFHSRDTPWTEKLDYFSAGLYILYGLFVAVLRIFHIRHRLAIAVWACLCAGAFTAHVTYLARLPRFDYGYNMLACLIIGGIQTSLWLIWSIWNVKKRSYAWMAGVSVVLVSLAMCLEIFDFPPWLGTLDAHSLWHAATIPLAPLFYRFLLRDAYAETNQTSVNKRSS